MQDVHSTVARPSGQPIILREVIAGIVAGIGSVPQTVPLGVLVFAPLGPEALPVGIACSLIAAVIGSLVAVLAGGIPVQITGPRASSCLLMAGFSLLLANDPVVAPNGAPRLDVAIVLIALMTLGVGAVQIFMGRIGIARSVKYVPYPVLVGFAAAVMMLIVWSFLPHALGFAADARPADVLTSPETWSWRAAVAAAVTVAATLLWARLRTPVPALLVGVAAGLAAHVMLHGPIQLGHMSVNVPAFPPVPVSASTFGLVAQYFAQTGSIVSFATILVALALVASLESLLSLSSFDNFENTYSDPDQELAAQGWANLATGLCFGIVSAASTARTRIAWDAGGRTQASVFVHCVLLAVILCLDDVLSLSPLPVVAGVMIVTALPLFDRWLLSVLRSVPDSADARRNALVVVSTVLVGILINPLLAVLFGLAMSILFVLRDMSRPIIRTELTGFDRRSRRMRTPAQLEALRANAGRIRVLVLDGTLFFGTGDTLRRRIEELARGPVGVLVLELSRVTDIDTSGRIALANAVRRLDGIGWSVALCGADGRARHMLETAGTGPAVMLPDLDRAMEWAEDEVTGPNPADAAALAFVEAASELVEHVGPGGMRLLAQFVETRAVPAGTVLFRAGDPGDALFVLGSGSVRIELTGPQGPIRIATFLPGVVFGEMAFLDGRPRSATAVVEADCVLYALPTAFLDALSEAFPVDAVQIVRNLGRLLAQRLRETNANFVSAE